MDTLQAAVGRATPRQPTPQPPPPGRRLRLRVGGLILALCAAVATVVATAPQSALSRCQGAAR